LLQALDPVWSGAYIVRNQGYLVYDTLFAVDANLQVQPQMAEPWRQSADGLATTLTLRPGLLWHDGTPVTAQDCVASLMRWQARDSMGQELGDSLKEYRVIDERSLAIVRLADGLEQRAEPLLQLALVNPVIEAFRQQRRLRPIRSCHERGPLGQHVLSRAGVDRSRHGRSPPAQRARADLLRHPGGVK
jgi:peptide/nickel transport system substrate-binding protein